MPKTKTNTRWTVAVCAMWMVAIASVAVPIMGQNPPANPPTTTTDPTGKVCTPPSVLNYVPSGTLFTCKSGVYTSAIGSGGATGATGPTGATGAIATPAPVSWGSYGTSAVNLTTISGLFGPIFGTTAIGATESLVQSAVSSATSLSGLQVKAGNIGASDTLTVTLRVNGASSALTCQIGSSGTACSDTTHSVAVNAGDLVDVIFAATGISLPATAQLAYGISQAGALGPAGATGVLAPNQEYTTSKVMDSSFCPSWLGTFTGSSALSFTLIAPIAGCSIGVQNNTTQAFTINAAANSVTLNGQGSNGSVPACATPANGCQVVIIKANGTTSWDMSAPGAIGPTGATGPSGVLVSGTSAMGTSAIGSGACATAVTTTATGALTTDNIVADFSADPTSTTGYAASASGMLTIIKYLTAGNVNFKVCNNTGGSITPGAVTLQWRVMR